MGRASDKNFSIGRKNWMFSDSVEGTKASSIPYGLTLTAKLNGKNPFETMVEISRRLPDTNTVDDYEEITDLLLSPPTPNSCHKKEGALIK